VPVVGSDGSARLGADLVAMTIDGALRMCVRGCRLSHLTIAHPPGWGPYEASVLRSALTCTAAEAVPTSLVSSPVAIVMATAAARMMSSSETAIVADIGATGTEVALVGGRRDYGGRPEALIWAGELATGELDRVLARHVLKQVRNHLPVPELHHPANRVLAEDVVARCRMAREALSRGTSTVVEVILPAGPIPVHVSSAEFDSLVGAPLRRGLLAFVQLLEHAKARGGTVDAIVLTGEPAGTVLLSRLLSTQGAPRVIIPPHPEWASATGAALVATDRLPHPPAQPAVLARQDRLPRHVQQQAVPRTPAHPGAPGTRTRRQVRKWTLRVGSLLLTATLASDPPTRTKRSRDGAPAPRGQAAASPGWLRPRLQAGP
jgi:molecular chaperone DnaK (HSP70)